jgi:hypothetical protein
MSSQGYFSYKKRKNRCITDVIVIITARINRRDAKMVKRVEGDVSISKSKKAMVG